MPFDCDEAKAGINISKHGITFEDPLALTVPDPEPPAVKEEYTEGDLKDGIRGKYYAAYQKSHNVVRLHPDVSAAFPSPIRIARASAGAQSDSSDR